MSGMEGMRNRKGRETDRNESKIQSGRKEPREKQRDREVQQLLMQTNLLLSAVVHSRLSTLLHTDLQCHSLPLAAHMKWQEAQALSQQATAATDMVRELVAGKTSACTETAFLL